MLPNPFVPAVTAAALIASHAHAPPDESVEYEEVSATMVKFDAEGKALGGGIEVKSGDRVEVTCSTSTLNGHRFNYNLLVNIYTGGKKPKTYKEESKDFSESIPAALGKDFSVGVAMTRVDGTRERVNQGIKSAVFSAVREEEMVLSLERAKGGTLYLKDSSEYLPVHDAKVEEEAKRWTEAEHVVLQKNKGGLNPPKPGIEASSDAGEFFVTVTVRRPKPPVIKKPK